MRMFYAGQWRDAAKKIEVRNPYDDTVIDTVPSATAEDVEAALVGAVAGSAIMAKTPGYKRYQILLKAAQLMTERADDLGHRDQNHYLWCASQHHKFDPTKPASHWHSAWRALRKSAGLAGFRFHDLRHTVVTDLLEAGEPEHVIEAVTGHLSRRMLEHYSHQRLKAKGQMLARMEERRKKKQSA